MKSSKKMRELLAGEEIVVIPGAHDALTAKIIANAGFSAVYMTGYGQAASHLGVPDVGLITQTEMFARASNIVEAVYDFGIPVFADADTGFGNAINTMRTIRLYENAGVAAIQLEDQVAPKKCGHMTGRQVIPAEEMVGKIKAAVDARRNDIVIVARTDARTIHGIDEAIRRGKMYDEAGADVIFIESPETVGEMRLITSTFSKPCLANMLEGGRTPLLSAAELQEIGFKIALFPVASTYTACKAVMDLMAELKKTGTTRHMMDKMVFFDQFNQLIGLPAIREAETKYFGG